MAAANIPHWVYSLAVVKGYNDNYYWFDKEYDHKKKAAFQQPFIGLTTMQFNHRAEVCVC